MANYAPLNASNMAAGGHSNPNAHIANWQPRVDHLFCERIALSLIRPLCHQQIVVVEGNYQQWSSLVSMGMTPLCGHLTTVQFAICAN